MNIQNVTVAGGGVLGSQIAYQAAFKAFNVTLYDINQQALTAAKNRITALRDGYKQDLNVTDSDFDNGLAHLNYTDDIAGAVSHADLVIEAIPENAAMKTTFYNQIGNSAPDTAIFASNSSTMLPSQFAEATGRPERFLNMHFANHIWVNNTAEIMGSPKTNSAVYQDVVTFAKNMGMVPIQLKKEQPGYVLNSMLTPLMVAGMSLWATEVADPHTIDKTWMIATGAPMGPFAILDMIGTRTAITVPLAQAGDPDGKIAAAIKAKLQQRLDASKLGIESGEGFYHYPNPEFQDPDFLKA